MGNPWFYGTWGPTNLLVGEASFAHVAQCVKEARAATGGSIAVLCGKSAMREQGFLTALLHQLPAKQTELFDETDVNPTFTSCQRAADFLVNLRPTHLIALGGGSAIDTAKIANIAAGSELSVHDLLRTTGTKPPLHRVAEHFVAVPTTAGTGSEVTSFATLWDFESPKKHSLDTPLLRASRAILDPSLTVGMPRELTVTTAVDALGHALESIWSRRSSPMSSSLALQAVRLIVEKLPQVLHDPGNTKHRADVLWASLLAGMAISMTQTAAAHAISYSLTLRFGVPHGLAHGVLLPEVLELNQHHLGRNEVEALKDVWNVEDDAALVPAFRQFLASINVVRPLGSYGITEDDLDVIVQDSNVTGRMDNNCRTLSNADIQSLVKAAL